MYTFAVYRDSVGRIDVLTLIWQPDRLNVQTRYDRLEYHRVVNYPLDVAGVFSTLEFGDVTEQIESLSRLNDGAEFGRVYASKTDETLQFVNLFYEKARKLCGRFNHYNGRHQGPAGDMPANPEFVLSYILVAQNQKLFFVVPKDAVELLHFMTLGIHSANRFFIEDWLAPQI